jgi:hypothetical protein
MRTPIRGLIVSSFLVGRINAVQDNSCSVCPDGISVIYCIMAPCEFGDFSKCDELIDDAKFLEAGSDDCRRAEIDAYYCCNTCHCGIVDPATGECPPMNEDCDQYAPTPAPTEDVSQLPTAVDDSTLSPTLLEASISSLPTIEATPTSSPANMTSLPTRKPTQIPMAVDGSTLAPTLLEVIITSLPTIQGTPTPNPVNMTSLPTRKPTRIPISNGNGGRTAQAAGWMVLFLGVAFLFGVSY